MNRTSKGIKNSKVALIYYVANIILGFISRKVLLNHLGADIVGLNTTAQNLLGFLNLAELGIGTAIAFTLYKPLAEKDIRAVQEIVSVQGWLYRRIAMLVLMGAFVLMLFFPLIFDKSGLPLWYAYTSFGVYLYSSFLTYISNYRQILYSANQQEYKITIHYKCVLLLQSIVQIFAVSLFDNGYIWWLIIQVVGATFAAWNLNRAIGKSFPFLEISINKGKLLSKKYPVIIEKVRQLFVHRIALFVLTQTSPIIIYAYTTLRVVAIYGNYQLIIHSITMMFTSVFNGVTAGVGNLVAEGDKKKILAVYNELFSSRFFCTCVFCYCIYKLVNPFVILWVGEDFLLPSSTILLMLGNMYLMMTRTTTDAYIAAFGLYQDISAPIIEGVLNISLSVFLGKYWGINGVLSGSLISMLCVVFFWKPYFLFSKGFQQNVLQYVRMYFLNIVSLVIAIGICQWLTRNVGIYITSYIQWIIQGLGVLLSFSLILFIIQYILCSGFRVFVHRMYSLVSHN